MLMGVDPQSGREVPYSISGTKKRPWCLASCVSVPLWKCTEHPATGSGRMPFSGVLFVQGGGPPTGKMLGLRVSSQDALLLAEQVPLAGPDTLVSANPPSSPGYGEA